MSRQLMGYTEEKTEKNILCRLGFKDRKRKAQFVQVLWRVANGPSTMWVHPLYLPNASRFKGLDVGIGQDVLPTSSG